MPTKTKTEPVTFISKRARCRAVVTGDWDEFHTGGTFTRHKGRTVEFVDNRFQTEDPELADLLRGHAEFGDAFMEVTVEQVAPAPTVELGAIGALAAEADAEGLRRLIDAEREGYARETVLTAAQTTLEAVEKVIASATSGEDA